MNNDCEYNRIKKALTMSNTTKAKIIAFNKSEFNEMQYQPSSLVIKGLYHEINKRISTSKDESSQSESFTTLKQPMFFVLYKDIESLKLNVNDILEMSNGVQYKISGFNNFNNENELVDISLEVTNGIEFCRK